MISDDQDPNAERPAPTEPAVMAEDPDYGNPFADKPGDSNYDGGPAPEDLAGRRGGRAALVPNSGPCPLFKVAATVPGRTATLRAPRDCQTQPQVVAAFNTDRDFTLTGMDVELYLPAARRTELWTAGYTHFIVYYHNGERIVGLRPK